MFNQLSLFRKYLDNRKEQAEDDDFVETSERAIPKANIFRYVAANTEKMKHEESLRRQIHDIARKYEPYILDRISRDASGAPPHHLSAPAACEQYLLHTLLTASVEDVSGAQPLGLNRGTGFPAINYFLKDKSVNPERTFFGLFLIPSRSSSRLLWFKNRFMALLIAAIMITGPVMVFCFNWATEDNPLYVGDLWEELTWKEITCFGSASELGVTIVGTLFLICIFEIARSYAEDEAENSKRMGHLPADGFWMTVGQLCNLICVFVTVLAMPLVFWREMAPKDIIFDSLAMLFLFQLDDFAGGALEYLDMQDSDFQEMYLELVACLGQCPARLEDVFTMTQSPIDSLWRLRWGEHGLLHAKVEYADKYVERRLVPQRANQSALVLKHPEHAPGFSYSIYAGERFPLRMTFLRPFWILMWWLLLLGEIVVPVTFAFVNKPCYGDRAEIGEPVVVAASTTLPPPVAVPPATAAAPVEATPAAPVPIPAPVPAPAPAPAPVPTASATLPPAPETHSETLLRANGAKRRNTRRR